MRCVVHGDDCTVLGFEEDLKELVEHFKEWYDVKVRGMIGGDEEGDHEITILNGKVRWMGDVMEYEADEKHGKESLCAMGLEKGFERDDDTM